MERINYINGEYKIGEKNVYIYCNGILWDDYEDFGDMFVRDKELGLLVALQSLKQLGFSSTKLILSNELVKIMGRICFPQVHNGVMIKVAIHAGLPTYYDAATKSVFIEVSV